MKYPSRALTLSVVAALMSAASTATSQSLRGSHASVDLMYRRAIRGGLDFYETTSAVRRAVVRGELVALGRSRNFTVHNVRAPYVRPETRAFVVELAADYRRACGKPLVITSAARPMSRRLANGSDLSVHPTGMAVDLRKPSGRCLTWLRKALLAAERRGEIEATEERRPPHFHVAVLPPRYRNASAQAGRPASSRPSRAGR